MDPVLLAVLAVTAAGIALEATRRRARRSKAHGARTRQRGAARRPYPGDFEGRVDVTYSPVADTHADPGEIVWTWVPFEEDHTRGKDRPVLIIGTDGRWLLALQLTSKDHDADAADEARWGRRWLDIGSGPWDTRRRPSEVRLDRIVRVDPRSVRRQGAILDRARFEQVARSLSDLHHW